MQKKSSISVTNTRKLVTEVEHLLGRRSVPLVCPYLRRVARKEPPPNRSGGNNDIDMISVFTRSERRCSATNISAFSNQKGVRGKVGGLRAHSAQRVRTIFFSGEAHVHFGSSFWFKFCGAYLLHHASFARATRSSCPAFVRHLCGLTRSH